MNEAVGWVKHYMGEIPVLIHQPEGALFLWLWFQDMPIASLDLYKRLKAKGIFVIAGEHFFPGLESDNWSHKHECIRLSYAGDPKTVETGIKAHRRGVNLHLFEKCSLISFDFKFFQSNF